MLMTLDHRSGHAAKMFGERVEKDIGLPNEANYSRVAVSKENSKNETVAPTIAPPIPPKTNSSKHIAH